MVVEITKPAAALRLIQAAIVMEEGDVDKLATLVVAASALNLIRELLQKRGPSLETRILRMFIWNVAHGKVEGGSPTVQAIWAEIPEVVTSVRNGIGEGRFSHFMEIEIDASKSWGHWIFNSVKRPYNFLKHADRDFDQLIASDDVEPSDAIMMAICGYSMLFDGRVPEALQGYLDRYAEVNS